MDENRFFRTVWRINGLALLLLILLLGGVALYSYASQAMRDGKPAIIRNVADDPGNEERWRLGQMHEIPGARHVYIPLVSDNRNIKPKEIGFTSGLHSYGSSRDYFSPSRNILFIDKTTREMRWLFRDNKQLIENIDLLSDKPQHDRNCSAAAILYHVIKKDTNRNGVLDDGDLADIAISHVDGGDYREIIPSVERVIGAKLLNDGEVLVLYQAQGKGFGTGIRLGDFSVSKPREMPRILPSS